MRFRLILGIGTTLPAAGKVSAQINAAYRVNILFTSDSESRRNLTIRYTVRGRGVLTMGESPRLADPGGVINFKMEGGHLRFEINLPATHERTLSISSKLLTLGEGHTEIA